MLRFIRSLRPRTSNARSRVWDWDVKNGEIYDPSTNKRISIDHDHKSGYIRGLLIQKVNWLIDQWEKNSYGHLSMPPEIEKYKKNPPAFLAIGKIKYE